MCQKLEDYLDYVAEHQFFKYKKINIAAKNRDELLKLDPKTTALFYGGWNITGPYSWTGKMHYNTADWCCIFNEMQLDIDTDNSNYLTNPIIAYVFEAPFAKKAFISSVVPFKTLEQLKQEIKENKNYKLSKIQAKE